MTRDEWEEIAMTILALLDGGVWVICQRNSREYALRNAKRQQVISVEAFPPEPRRTGRRMGGGRAEQTVTNDDFGAWPGCIPAARGGLATAGFPHLLPPLRGSIPRRPKGTVGQLADRLPFKRVTPVRFRLVPSAIGLRGRNFG